MISCSNCWLHRRQELPPPAPQASFICLEKSRDWFWFGTVSPNVLYWRFMWAVLFSKNSALRGPCCATESWNKKYFWFFAFSLPLVVSQSGSTSATTAKRSNIYMNCLETRKVHSWPLFLVPLCTKCVLKKHTPNVPLWHHTGQHTPLGTVAAAWHLFCPPRPRLDSRLPCFRPFLNLRLELLLLYNKASISSESKTEGFPEEDCTQMA